MKRNPYNCATHSSLTGTCNAEERMAKKAAKKSKKKSAKKAKKGKKK